MVQTAKNTQVCARLREIRLLAVGSVALLIFGVIASLEFRLAPMSAFELILILVMLVGGLGLFLSALRSR